MYDDEPLLDPIENDQPKWDEDVRPSRARNCLFLGITFLLIASLVSSSVLAYFAVTYRDSRSIAEANGIRQTVIETGPTAAPATVVAAAATLLPTVPVESQAPPPEINRIALINENGQLETMSPSGEDRRVLTLASDNTRFQFPAWSPDGQRLAIIGSRTTGGSIFVLEDAARTGTLRENQIYFDANRTPIYLYWSPTSENLAFLSNEPRDSLGLNVIASDGTSDNRLLATGAPFYWDWSEDGRRLLIHSGRAGESDALALIDLEGQPQANNLATPGVFQAPGIGRGGRYWAFAEEDVDGLSALVVVDTQTGERTSLNGVGSLALGWNPDGSQIAFTKGAVNGHPFWGSLNLLNVETGEEKLISTQTVLAFFWSPDGKRIAFVTIGNERNDDGINVSLPHKSSRLSRPAGNIMTQFGQGFLTLSVVDIETGQGLRLLDFEPTLPYLTQFLPYFDQYALSHQVWSPDSSAIVLPVRHNDSSSIMVVSIEGRRAYELAEGDIAFWSHN